MSSTRSASDKNVKKPLKTLKLARRGSTDDRERPAKRFCLSNPPVFDLTKDFASSSQDSTCLQPVSQTVKGKGKEARTENDSMWVDKYAPTSEAELAVHKRKVDDVRRWLSEAFEGGPSGKLRKYRRVLALTGPAGTGKTSTIRILSRELGIEILEWRNSMSEPGSSACLGDELDFEAESLFDKFQAFLTRAMACNSVLGHDGTTQRSSSARTTQRTSRHQLILLEDLPNLLHQPTRVRFQTTLRSLCIPARGLSGSLGPPIVIIISDSGLRGEHPDDDPWDGRRWDRKEVLDIRNILGPELLTSPYVTRIGFNSIAPTLMTKALQTLVVSHFGTKADEQSTREVIDIIVGSSNGDIRSAIMALQFACVVDLAASKPKGKTRRRTVGGPKRTTNVRAVLEAVTRREQSLVLFHLLGKVFYNKRKFDPPASHLSAKDAAKERESDVQLTDPPPLPIWLSYHDRKASRVCTETLAAESPIDSSLLGLYTHQNYAQFCTDIDQCDGICEGLSWVDSTVGSSNSPYAFPALTLSTLHSLPTPVPRRGQKVCKPTWFDIRTRELEAMDAVGDVFEWLGKGVCMDGEPLSTSVGRWTYASIATELGGWLCAFDRRRGDGMSERHARPPRTHRLFSHLAWSVDAARGDVLGEDEEGGDGGDGDGDGDGDVKLPGGTYGRAEERRGWLEEDEIENVD